MFLILLRGRGFLSWCCEWLVFWRLLWHPLVALVVRVSPVGVLAFMLASAFCYWCFTRCPCAGRHLLFFAAAKKSRQKKAAHTASSCVCLRAPTGSYTSHGNHVTHV